MAIIAKGGFVPLLLLLATVLDPQWVYGNTISKRGVDNPSPADFVRRFFQTATVLGDYVYIDGGELVQIVDGNQPDSNHASYAVNTTLSLSLKESWTNSSVSLRSIPKTAPLLDTQAIWTDPSSNTFYTWGGVTAWFAQAPENGLWQFKADGSGGGSWSQVQPSNIVVFNQLIRPNSPAFASSSGVSSEPIGYAFSGEATAYSDSSIAGGQTLALPGLVSYNMATGEWANTSSAGFRDYGTLLSGQAEYVPFGTEGLLLFLGGSESDVANTTDGSQKNLDWTNLTLYDPATNKWHSQTTTGSSRPHPLLSACTVGAKGPNGTYEIFIYGGNSITELVMSDDVYVLSLPGFVFFKAPSSGTPRGSHSCVVVGKGGRQMLSVGGTNNWLGYPADVLDVDPWKQGLGIFDMVDLQWTDGFDANASDYDSPSVVKDWYSQGGLASVEWTDDEVKALFLNSSTSSDNASTTGTGSSSGTSSSSSSDSSSRPSVGAIVGGTVGGVVALALMGGIACYFICKMHSSKTKAGQDEVGFAAGGTGDAGMLGAYSAVSQSPGEKSELETNSHYPQELSYGHYPPIELPADHGRTELNTHIVGTELPDHNYGGFTVRT